MSWERLFLDFESLHVLVVGDVMTDAYVFGKVDRISPEAPVPVVAVEKRESRPGGAANVALNLRSLGAKVSIASVIGEDEAGKELLALLRREQIETSGIYSSKNHKTTVKQRVIGNNMQMLRIDDESTNPLFGAEKNFLLEWIKQHIGGFQVIIFEDYDKGVLDKPLIAEIISLAEKSNIPTVVDPKKRNFLHYQNSTFFKPNLKEIKEGLKTDKDLKEENNLREAVRELQSRLNTKTVMVTLSEQGVALSDRDEWIRLPAHTRNIADVSGAGDTVVSVAACCLALNCSAFEIAFLSNLAGGLVCEKTGVVPVDKEILLKEAKRIHPLS
jgi:rfaE bifunctional protein kinase chain/domain